MYTTYKGDVEAEFMETVGFDAVALGNHEFDDGPEGLDGFLGKVSFPVLSGNLDLSQSNLLKGKLKPYVILEVGGEKIGIVSALAIDTVETLSTGPAVIFQDEIESPKADVAELDAQGVNKIIALTHVGVTKDLEIAGAVAGLDAVVGGHSHTLFSNSTKGAMAYPTMVGTVPVVQAYAYSKYARHLQLTFDDAGGVTQAAGDTVLLDASIVPDAAILARAAALAGPIEELKNKIVAESAREIDGTRENCRAKGCAMGNLIADAMLDRVKDQGIEIAIQNGSGVRPWMQAL